MGVRFSSVRSDFCSVGKMPERSTSAPKVSALLRTNAKKLLQLLLHQTENIARLVTVGVRFASRLNLAISVVSRESFA